MNFQFLNFFIILILYNTVPLPASLEEISMNNEIMKKNMLIAVAIVNEGLGSCLMQ